MEDEPQAAKPCNDLEPLSRHKEFNKLLEVLVNVQSELAVIKKDQEQMKTDLKEIKAEVKRFTKA